MGLWLTVALAAATVNIGLVLVLGAVWLRSYRRHGATHTLGLLVVAAFLLIENLLWTYFYGFHSDFIGWFVNSTPTVQIGLTLLCALELVALLTLVRITWL